MKPSQPIALPSPRARAREEVPLRQRLIDESLLRSDRNEHIAPEPRDRLMVVHIPRWVPVLRLVDDRVWS